MERQHPLTTDNKYIIHKVVRKMIPSPFNFPYYVTLSIEWFFFINFIQVNIEETVFLLC